MINNSLSKQTRARFAGLPRKVLGKKVRGPIGLHFGNEALHMVQFSVSDDNPDADEHLSLCASVSQPYAEDPSRLTTSPAELRRWFKHASRLHDFRGNQVVSCMRSDQVKIVAIQYVQKKNLSQDEAVVEGLKKRIDKNISDYVVDYVPVRQSSPEGQEQIALVAMSHRDDVIEYLELLRLAGLYVRALEVGPTAINRLVSSMPGHHHESNTLVLTLGKKMSYLTVLSGRRLIFDHEVNWGENKLIDQLATALHVEYQAAHDLAYSHGLSSERHSLLSNNGNRDEEIRSTIVDILKPLFLELREEINKALIYTASETRGKIVESIYISGSIACWRGMENLLYSLINIPVYILDPMSRFRSNRVQSDNIPAQVNIAIAAGLALHGLSGEK